MKLRIVTPEKTTYQAEDVSQLTLPTQQGEITILPNHIPLVSVLKAGEMIVKKDNEEISMALSGGFVEIKENEIVVLADTAERADEIDEEKAEEARKRAEKLLEEAKDKETVDYVALAAKMEKELARLKVARKKKYKNVK